MKIVVEVPDLTRCVFVNYLAYTITGDLEMGCKSISTDDLEEAKTKESEVDTE